MGRATNALIWHGIVRLTERLDCIHVGKVIAFLNDEAAAEAYQAEYDQTRGDESMEF